MSKISLRLVEPSKQDDKAGCIHCPLAAHSADFRAFRKSYQRDWRKEKSKLREPHVVINRNISQSWTPVDVLFVGEAPGDDENNQGEPFMGRSGSLLRRTVEIIFKKTIVGYAYTVRCPSPLNRSPSKTEMTCCTPDLAREIRARKPKLIVAVGNKALLYFTGREGITNLNGRRIVATGEFEGTPVVPLLHPNFILRQDFQFDKFKAAMKAARKWLREIKAGGGQNTDGPGKYEVVDTVRGVRRLVARIKRAGRAAVDTETGSLSVFQNKYPKLLCFSFSYKEKTGFTVPLDHFESPWTLSIPRPTFEAMEGLSDPPKGPDKYKSEKGKQTATENVRKWREIDLHIRGEALDAAIKKWKRHRSRAERERPIVVEILRDLLSDPEMKWTAQNEKFDRQHIRKALGVNIRGEVFDTLLAHFVCNELPGTHGLDLLAHEFTGMGDYDKPLADYVAEHIDSKSESGGSYAFIPGSVLFPYAAGDTDVTLRVANRIVKSKEYNYHPQHKRLAEVWMPNLSLLLGDLEYAGAKVDQAVVRKLRDETQAKLEEVKAEIDTFPDVQLFEVEEIKRLMVTDKSKARTFLFNPGSDQQVGKLLWEFYGLPPLEATDSGLEVLKQRYARLSKDDPDIDSDDIWRAAVENKEWHLFSTKAETLFMYDKQGNPLAGKLLKYREYDKLLGTYYNPILEQLDENSLVHGSFNATGTRCVAAGTLILTSRGEVPIEQIVTHRVVGLSQVRDGILVWDGAQWRQPEATYYGGFKKCAEIKTDDGGEIICTLIHPLLSRNGWIVAGDIKCGDSLFRYGLSGSLCEVRVVSVMYREHETFDLVIEKVGVCDSVPHLQSTLRESSTACGGRAQNDVGRISQEISKLPSIFASGNEATKQSQFTGNEEDESNILEQAGESQKTRSAVVRSLTEKVARSRVCRASKAESSARESFGSGIGGAIGETKKDDARASGVACERAADVIAATKSTSAPREDAENSFGTIETTQCNVLEKARQRSAKTKAVVGNNEEDATRSRVYCRDDERAARSAKGHCPGNEVTPLSAGILAASRESGEDERSNYKVKSSGANGATVAERVRAIGTPRVSSIEVCRESKMVAKATEREIDQSGFFGCGTKQSHRTIRRVLAPANGQSRANRPMEICWDKVLGCVVARVESRARENNGTDSTVRITHAFVTNGFISHNTGRLSSSRPNLQNIPREARLMYVSRFKGGVLVSCDYSQVELRVACSLYRDKTMRRTYARGEDIHRETTLAICGMSADEYDALDKDKQEWWRTLAKRINFGCVPMDTEALTPGGWKRYEQIKVGDKVLGYENGEMKWTTVRKKHHYRDARTVRMKSGKTFDVIVTPNHRWTGVVRRGAKRIQSREMFETRDVTGDHVITLSAPAKVPDRSGLSVRDAAVLGWVFCDGSYIRSPIGGTSQGRNASKRKTLAYIFQSTTRYPEKCAQIHHLLRDVPHTYRTRPSGIGAWHLKTVYWRELWERLDLDRVPLADVVLRMGSEQREAFLSACIVAEGYSTGHMTILTQNEGPVADAMRIAAFMSGYFVRENVAGVYKGNICKKLRLSKPRVTGQRMKIVSHKRQDVWCLTTDTGTWVMRQNGQTMVTGNSIYGIGAAGIVRALQGEGVFLDESVVQAGLDAFKEMRWELFENMNKHVRKVVKNKGRYTTFMGRTFRVLELLSRDEKIFSQGSRQIINFPVQGDASDMTCLAAAIARLRMKKEKLKAKIILLVHDNIVADAPMDEALRVAFLIQDSMRRVRELSDMVYPGLDWSWLKVPIEADADIGYVWSKKFAVKYTPEMYADTKALKAALDAKQVA